MGSAQSELHFNTQLDFAAELNFAPPANTQHTMPAHVPVCKQEPAAHQILDAQELEPTCTTEVPSHACTSSLAAPSESRPQASPSLENVRTGGQAPTRKAPGRTPGQVFVVPRRKTGQQCADVMPVVLNLELLKQYTSMPLYSAAALLGLSTTALKKACRRLGVRRWPHASRSPAPPAAAAASFCPRNSSIIPVDSSYVRRVQRKYGARTRTISNARKTESDETTTCASSSTASTPQDTSAAGAGTGSELESAATPESWQSGNSWGCFDDGEDLESAKDNCDASDICALLADSGGSQALERWRYIL